MDPDLDPERVFGSSERLRTVSDVAKRRWRFYETAAGRKVVREQLDALDADGVQSGVQTERNSGQLRALSSALQR